MRFLLTSLLLILCASCISYPKKNSFKTIENEDLSLLNPYFSNAFKDYVYKANIAAFDNDFGGIFIVKKLAPDHHRVAFTTELGNTIFDFTFKGDDFKVNQILKELDKKLLINILRNDFRVLLKERPFIKKTFQSKNDTVFQTDIVGKTYFHYRNQGFLNKIVKVKNSKHQVEFLFSEINDDLAKHIEINHQNLKLSIRLKSI